MSTMYERWGSEAMARRAVACKGWRWMPGMRAVSPSGKHWRVWSDTRSVYEPEGCMDSAPAEWSKDVPDLTDPATLGCLLALVREARLDPHYQPTWLGSCSDAAWVIDPPSRDRQTRHESYASVLVAALEAAS